MQAVWNAAQHRGRREYQEDFFAVVDGGRLAFLGRDYPAAFGGLALHQSLCVMADGMGGMGHGDLAAATIVEQFVDTFLREFNDGTSPDRALERAAHEANQAVADMVLEDPEKHGMGATLIAVYCDSEAAEAHWLSVGDSVLALFRQQQLQRLNEQHTLRWLVERRRAAGESVEGWDVSGQGDALCSAVSGFDLDYISRSEQPLSLHPGDVLMIASDGIETLSDGKLNQVLGERLAALADIDGAAAAEQQIGDAVSSIFATLKDYDVPYQDNTTVILLGLYPLTEHDEVLDLC